MMELSGVFLSCQLGAVFQSHHREACWKTACVDFCSVIKGLLAALKVALQLNRETGVWLTTNTYLGRRSRLI